MTIFTVIVSYNAIPWLNRCLGSLQASSEETTVIVVDNCSTDNTCDYIRTHYPKVILLPQDKNLGFGQANNIGIRYALAHSADYVLLLNQDAWISEDMLTVLLAFSDGNSLMSPIHWRGDEKEIDLRFRKNAVERGGYGILVREDVLLRQKPTVCETYEINAACWLLPRRILEEIGGFNPIFYHYAEDINYLHRLHYHHKKVCFVTGIHMVHDRKQQYDSPICEQLVYQQIALNMTNIGQSIVKAWLQVQRYGLALVRRAIREHKREYVTFFNRGLKRAWQNAANIRASRKKEKTLQANWL